MQAPVRLSRQARSYPSAGSVREQVQQLRRLEHFRWAGRKRIHGFRKAAPLQQQQTCLYSMHSVLRVCVGLHEPV